MVISIHFLLNQLYFVYFYLKKPTFILITEIIPIILPFPKRKKSKSTQKSSKKKKKGKKTPPKIPSIMSTPAPIGTQELINIQNIPHDDNHNTTTPKSNRSSSVSDAITTTPPETSKNHDTLSSLNNKPQGDDNKYPKYPFDDNQPPLPPPTLEHQNSLNSPNPGQPEPAQDPRGIIAGEFMGGRNVYTTRLIRSLQIVENLVEIILICVFLPLHWSRTCDKGGLRVFLIARAIIDAFFIVLHGVNFSTPRTSGPKFFRSILSLTEYCFVIYALVQIGDVESCNGSTYILSLTLCILSIVIILSPLFLLLLICCCLPCIIGALVRYIELINAPVGATDDQLSELVELKWTPTLFEENGALAQPECPVCMVEYEEDGSSIVILPCHHPLHYSCFTQWAKINKTCPSCRQSPWADPNDDTTPQPTLETAQTV